MKKISEGFCVLMRITSIERPVRYWNLSQEEWKVQRSLSDERNMVIKRADKGFCVVIRITAIES